MENQKKLLVIRPSRTPKTNPNKNFCSKSLPTMGASTWFLCVVFYVCLQSLCNKSPITNFLQKPGKSHIKPSAKGDARLK